MIHRRFKDYVVLRENENKDDSKGIESTVTLGKSNAFPPFIVTDDPRNPNYPSNKNLAPIIRAFKDSKKVKVYDSIDKDGKSKPHTLGTKNLYLVGGAVRDHLLGKTPHDIDLATDATPDEIRMILIDAGFKPRNQIESPTTGKSFYVKGRDKSNGEFVFGVIVRHQEFDLATFRKDSEGSDGRHPDSMEFGSHKDDADRRDLTINSLYLKLTNDDGPNNQIIDFHGGIHDLENKKVRFVGNPKDRLREDLLRALRYARFSARFGEQEIPNEILSAIREISPEIRDTISPERIYDEFVKALQDDSVDPNNLLRIYNQLHLLDAVFPGLKINHDLPEGRNRNLIVAAMLKDNHPDLIHNVLRNGRWSSKDISRIGFLHDLLHLSQEIDPESLDRLLSNYYQSGISNHELNHWWKKYRNDNMINHFLNFASAPRVKIITNDLDHDRQIINPEFADLIDPIRSRAYHGKEKMVGQRKKIAEHREFLRMIQN